MRFFYGCRKDEKDDRDHKFMLGAPVHSAIDFPASIDLGPWLSPVMDQAATSTCTAHAVTAAMRYDLLNITGHDVELSRLQLYWESGLIEKCEGQDNGRQIRDVVKAAATVGVCPETLWPFDPDKMFRGEDPQTLVSAAEHIISDYQRVTPDSRSVKMALFMGRPVVIGVELFSEFEGDDVYRTGNVPMPSVGQTPIGLHCMLLHAYSERGFKVRNSWGPQWGEKGNCWLPYGYIEKYGYDFWVVLTNT